MGNANVFRKLKERYDRGNMTSYQQPHTLHHTTAPTIPATPTGAISDSVSFDDDNEIMVISSSGWPTSSSRGSEPNIIITPMVIDSPSNGHVRNMSHGSLTRSDSKDNSPSSSPRVSLSQPSSMSISPSSSPVSSAPSTPSSRSSYTLSSLPQSVVMSPTSITSVSSPSSTSASSISSPSAPTVIPKKRFSLKAAIQNKLAGRSSKKVEIPPWIPTNPELILDEKGLHEVFDRFDADRNGTLCMKEMRNMLLELLEYCIAVEKALLKQAHSGDDTIGIDLAHHSLIRLQSIQNSQRLIDMWTFDLYGQLDADKDGRVDRVDFVRSFNHHLRLY